MIDGTLRWTSARLAIVGLILAIGVCRAEPDTGKPAIHVITDKAGRPIAFEATGLNASKISEIAKREDGSATFAKFLSVSVVDDSDEDSLPSMAGTHAADGSSLRFTPRYALRPGLRYRAVLVPNGTTPDSRPKSAKGQADANSVTLEVTVPQTAAGEPTEVTHVYPTSATLPENQLKFYIHFSAPMGRGEAYEHARLLDAKGRPADLPFLELAEELWDASGKRLTLLIDPGRIKRGLKPREDLGPVLEAGREYTLVIDRAWRDASGRALKGDFRKRFRTTAPIEEGIDETAWKIVPPAAGSKDPLIVRFPRPLDHALMERTIMVVGVNGTRLAGSGKAADEEQRFEFQPEKAWPPGKYQLIVDTSLEDLAGNRIGRAFDFDELGTIDKRALGETVSISFKVGE
jgi:hypothetical protein